MRQQLGGRAEGIRERAVVLDDRADSGAGFIQNEAPADRVIDPDLEFRVCLAVGREAHAVGMQRQPLAPIQQQIAPLVECDAVATV